MIDPEICRAVEEGGKPFDLFLRITEPYVAGNVGNAVDVLRWIEMVEWQMERQNAA